VLQKTALGQFVFIYEWSSTESALVPRDVVRNATLVDRYAPECGVMILSLDQWKHVEHVVVHHWQLAPRDIKTPKLSQ
jgi:hypothetical protein